MEVAQAGVGDAITASTYDTFSPEVLATAILALSRLDIEAMSASEAEAVVLATERAKAGLEARQSLAMEVLASRVEEQAVSEHAELVASLPPGPARDRLERSGGSTDGLVASLLAPALHLSTRAVAKRLEAARRLVCLMESTFAAVWDGDLERHRAEVVVEAGEGLASDATARYEAMVLETLLDEQTGEITLVSDRIRSMCRANLARRARRIAASLNEDPDRAAAEEATRRRALLVRPSPRCPGLARWEVLLPSDVSSQVFAAVDTLASEYLRASPGAPIEALRADALSDLVLGNAEVATQVELLIPVLKANVADTDVPRAAVPDADVPDADVPDADDGNTVTPLTATVTTTSMGTGVASTDQPSGAGGPVSWLVPGAVDDPRHGVLLPEALTALLADPDVAVRLTTLDPDGAVAQDPTRYRPHAATRRRVRSRDGICRFPGCHTPAHRCDLDHVMPFPKGPTLHTNLISLCRTHHRFKHRMGWRVTLAPDGAVTWISRDGRSWETTPRPHQLAEDLRLTEHLDPGIDHDLRRGWFPGLPPGMSMADIVAAERALPDDPGLPDQVPAPPTDWGALDDILLMDVGVTVTA